MSIKSSIGGIQHTCINFLIFLIITKIECWPVFKQDPLDRTTTLLLRKTVYKFLHFINHLRNTVTTMNR